MKKKRFLNCCRILTFWFGLSVVSTALSSENITSNLEMLIAYTGTPQIGYNCPYSQPGIPCNVCTFATTDLLIEHVQQAHKCGLKELEEHLEKILNNRARKSRAHQPKSYSELCYCNHCDKSFHSEDLLQDHQKIHAGKQYQPKKKKRHTDSLFQRRRFCY